MCDFSKLLHHLAGENIKKDYFLSQRIEYTWIGAYTFCRMNGMKLVNLASSRQFTHFRGLASSSSKFPRVFIDIINSSEQVSCKLSPSNIFPNAKITKRSCDITKGAFVCEDIEGQESEGNSLIEPFFQYFPMELAGIYGRF